MHSWFLYTYSDLHQDLLLPIMFCFVSRVGSIRLQLFLAHLCQFGSMFDPALTDLTITSRQKNIPVGSIWSIVDRS